jgi:excisionase family DNA binding protein
MDDHASAVLPAESPVVDQLYTTDEVAKLLRVSQRTVQVWIRDGMLTAVRYGRLLRIRQADLAAFGEVLPRRTPPLAPRTRAPVPRRLARRRSEPQPPRHPTKPRFHRIKW